MAGLGVGDEDVADCVVDGPGAVGGDVDVDGAVVLPTGVVGRAPGVPVTGVAGEALSAWVTDVVSAAAWVGDVVSVAAGLGWSPVDSMRASGATG